MCVLDTQCPGIGVVVCDGEPRVVRDDVFMDRQDSSGISLDPSHLNPFRNNTIIWILEITIAA
jgi:hypothetical protein